MANLNSPTQGSNADLPDFVNPLPPGGQPSVQPPGTVPQQPPAPPAPASPMGPDPSLSPKAFIQPVQPQPAAVQPTPVLPPGMDEETARNLFDRLVAEQPELPQGMDEASAMALFEQLSATDPEAGFDFGLEEPLADAAAKWWRGRQHSFARAAQGVRQAIEERRRTRQLTVDLRNTGVPGSIQYLPEEFREAPPDGVADLNAVDQAAGTVTASIPRTEAERTKLDEIEEELDTIDWLRTQDTPRTRAGSMADIMFNVGGGIADSLIALGPGLAVPGLGPVTSAALVGQQVFGNAYRDARLKGADPGKAWQVASLHGAAEMIPEAFIVGQALNDATGLVRRVLATGGYEAVQEGMTEALTIGIEMGVFDENTPLKEALQRVAMAAGAGGVAGGIFGGLAHPIVRERAKTAEARQWDRIMTDMGFRSGQRLPDQPIIQRPDSVPTADEVRLDRLDFVLTLLEREEEILQGSGKKGLAPKQARLKKRYEREYQQAVKDVYGGEQLELFERGSRTDEAFSRAFDDAIRERRPFELNTTAAEQQAAYFRQHPGVRMDRLTQQQELDPHIIRDLPRKLHDKVIYEESFNADRRRLNEMLPFGLRQLAVEWAGPAKADSLNDFVAEIVDNDAAPEYRRALRTFLDEKFPGTESILVWRGQNNTHPKASPIMFQADYGAAPKYAFNASLEYNTAQSWAAEGEGTISVIEVPKDNIAGVQLGSIHGEFEILAKTEGALWHGTVEAAKQPQLTVDIQQIGQRAEGAFDQGDLQRGFSGFGMATLHAQKLHQRQQEMLANPPPERVDLTEQMELFLAKDKPNPAAAPPEQLHLFSADQAPIIAKPEDVTPIHTNAPPVSAGPTSHSDLQHAGSMGDPLNVSGAWSVVSTESLGGNPGMLVRDPTGQQWYMKFMPSAAHLGNEALAGQLYKAVGVDVANLKIGEIDGETVAPDSPLFPSNGERVLLSKWEDQIVLFNHANAVKETPGVWEGFAADAWLANWDVVGRVYFDEAGNVVEDKIDNIAKVNGHAIRVDVGASLLFKGLGGTKGEKFDESVVEFVTLFHPTLNHATSVIYDGVMESDVWWPVAEKIAGLPDAVIDSLVDQWIEGAVLREELKAKLKSRRDHVGEVLAEKKAEFAGIVVEDLAEETQADMFVPDLEESLMPPDQEMTGAAGKQKLMNWASALDVSNIWGNMVLADEPAVEVAFGPLLLEDQQMQMADKFGEKYKAITEDVLDRFGLEDMQVLIVPDGFDPTHKMGYQPTLQVEGRRAIIHLPGTGAKVESILIETLVHELGHLIVHYHWANKTLKSVRTAIIARYQEWKQEIEVDAGFIDVKQPNVTEGFLPTSAEAITEMSDGMIAEDLVSFPEWLANQIVRWYLRPDKPHAAQASKEPMGAVEKVYKALANTLKKYHQWANTKGWLTKTLKPDQTVSDWLNALTQMLDTEYNASPVYAVGEKAPGMTYEANWMPTEQIHNMLDHFGIGDKASRRRMAQEMDRYNWWIRWTWNIWQIIEKNLHIQPLARYGELLDNWRLIKRRWVARADEGVMSWKNLGKGQAEALNEFMFHMGLHKYLAPNEDLRAPTEQELADAIKRFGLKPEAYEVYTQIQQDYTDFLKEVIEVRRTEIDALWGIGTPAAQERHARLDELTEALLRAPYVPLDRFGDWTIVVRDREGGEVVHMESFENKRERDRNLERVQKLYPDNKRFAVWRSQFHETFKGYRGMPPQLLEGLKEQLTLSEEQKKELDEYIYAHSPTKSFVNHFRRRRVVRGFSTDGLRAYANYFWHGSNHIARLKYARELENAITGVKATMRALAEEGNGIDIATRGAIAAHLERHKDYVLNPQNEWVFLRQVAFHWFLGFNVKAAMINLTQIPLATYPWLAEKFSGNRLTPSKSDAKAISHLVRAMKDVRKLYEKDGGSMAESDPAFMAALEEAQSQGFVDESQSMELAGMADSNVLSRAIPSNSVQRFFRDMGYASSWLFHNAENFNRRITFRAGWTMAQEALREGNLSPATDRWFTRLRVTRPQLYARLIEQGWSLNDATAFLAARAAVEETHFRYSGESRPELFRGRKSAVFVFFNYLQNMLWTGRSGYGRTLLLLLAAAGPMGLPGAEDIDEIVTWLAKVMGFNFRPSEELRRLLVEHAGSENPDYWLHGLGRSGMGMGQLSEATGVPLPVFDLSGSLSLGSIVPGLEGLNEPEFDRALSKGVQSTAGAALGLPLTMVQAMKDDHPDFFKRWERVMPTALRNISKAYRFGTEGRERSRTYAELVRYDMDDPRHAMEVLGQALGFTPTRQTRRWDFEQAQREKIAFWQARRARLLDAFTHMRAMGDSGAQDDLFAQIRRYNQRVPHPGLAISPDTLRSSVKARITGQRMRELGLPAQRSLIQTGREVLDQYPEVKTEIERLR